MVTHPANVLGPFAAFGVCSSPELYCLPPFLFTPKMASSPELYCHYPESEIRKQGTGNREPSRELPPLQMVLNLGGVDHLCLPAIRGTVRILETSVAANVVAVTNVVADMGKAGSI